MLTLGESGWRYMRTLCTICKCSVNLKLPSSKICVYLYKTVSHQRDITLPTKVCIVKAMVFPVIVYGCESWTIKKAERWRTDAFELWCWWRLLRVPWTIKTVNPKGDQPWIFIGSEIEQDLMVLPHPYYVLCLPSICGKFYSKDKFN